MFEDWPAPAVEWFDGETVAWMLAGLALILLVFWVWHWIDRHTDDVRRMF